MASKKSKKEKEAIVDESVHHEEDASNFYRVDEVVAGVFTSKRHTGQFNDRFETGEIEFNQNFKTGNIPLPANNPTTITKDEWADCVVHDLNSHDFDSNDDIMIWPDDYDENKNEF